MFSLVKKFFNNKSKDLELRERELRIKEREIEIKEKELNNKNIKNEVFYKKEIKVKKEYTIEEKKEYALKMKKARERGKEYEEFIAGYYKLDGYQIYLQGIKKGVKDKGIDIICKKDEELILIQCKNWKKESSYKIGHKELKAFVGSCTEYVNENKLFDKKIKLKFITSNYILNPSGKKFLEESKTLQYEVLKY